MKQLYIVNSDKFIGQAKFISLVKSELKLDEISPALLIYENVISRTEFGAQLSNELGSGNQLSKELMERLIQPEIIKLNSPLLVGYPNTQDQFNSLKDWLLSENIYLKAFFYFKNSRAINFGHIGIEEKEMITINVTELGTIDEYEFRSLLKSFA